LSIENRFYSTDSTFIHGGVDRPGSIEQPAVGPNDIARRINELNLRDCHAKIRQVDSHPTIGNGVVVQVTGELSNNGDPMRRFMQTFVLAPRQPKKYYVQNDIFRYQDEVFDDGSDEDDRSSSQIYGDTVNKIKIKSIISSRKNLFRIRFQMLIHRLQVHNNHYWSLLHHDQ
jgi:Ras GTPase-activating protein-binding protein 1